MKPDFRLLAPELVSRILDEAFLLLRETGVKVQLPEARQLLAEAGADVDENAEVVKLSERLIREAIASVPHEFFLYDRAGKPAVHYGGDSVQFDPGSSGVHYLDPDTLEHIPSETPHLVRVLKVAQSLPAYDAVSTSVVCNEVPKAIGDLYRLYLVLLYTTKPIVTGAFAAHTTHAMIDMLAIYAGGRQALAAQPLAVFDVCPTPPLIWSKFGCQNLIDLARAGVPAEMVSMPLAGAGSPVTILGSVVQHTAENLAGAVIHQLARPGAPLVWGGAPAIFDMRQGTTPMGAVETAMIDACYAQVGKALGFPTHTYLGATDGKVADYQAGLESGISALIGALARINMISGAGMFDFLACISPEKLVLDAEAIGMAKRLARGVEVLTDTLALEMFAGIEFKADFLKKKETRTLFSKEQYLPSRVIDRGSIRAWQDAGSPDAWQRAKAETQRILAAYQRPASPDQERALVELVSHLARQAGMDTLPPLVL
ncbi:MAG: trimethylamine methyltransferase family protein [Anaerolineales bacterium]|nr:trimethylamine methyltransferase family protein [Anaerolineales bacterium]